MLHLHAFTVSSHYVATEVYNTTPQPFYGPFSGTIQVSRCQKRISGLYGAREDNKGRHTDYLTD